MHGVPMSLHVRPPSSGLPPAPPTDDWQLIACTSAPPAIAADWPSLWVVAEGSLSMHARDSDWSLHAGDAQLWRGGALQVHPSDGARWFCLTGPLAAWQRNLAMGRDDEPLPWRVDGAMALPRILDALVHDDGDAPPLAALRHVLWERQEDIAAHLPHCRGRTARHRRQTLLRLLHLHHLMRCRIEADDEAMIDVAWLAERAHYSAGHLIRLHRDVFGQTPGEYVSRLRDERAWQLVRETDLPVVTITHKLGFESQSAFCRAFKHAFGVTATQARRGETPACAAA